MKRLGFIKKRLRQKNESERMNFKDHEVMSAIWMGNLEQILRKINNIKSLMIDMKAKTAIMLENVELLRSEEYSKKESLPKDGLNH